MNKHFPGLVAFTLATTAVVAGPQIGNLRDSDASQYCQFSANRESRAVVLEMKFREARMQLDGKLVSLSVKELDCLKDCVIAGASGVRIFELSGSGVRATLTKKVFCARDAEVCGGLPEGDADLRVSTAAGDTLIRIWSEYCDL